MDDEYFDASLRELAAGVLRSAVTDRDESFDQFNLELWCALVDLDPELFQEKLRVIITR